MNRILASAIVSLLLCEAMVADVLAQQDRDWARETSVLEKAVHTNWSEAKIRAGRQRDLVFMESTEVQKDLQHDSDLIQNAKHVAICRVKASVPWIPVHEKKQLNEQQLVERRNARIKWFAELIRKAEPGKLTDAEVAFLTSSDAANYEVSSPTFDDRGNATHEVRVYATSPEEAKQRMVAFLKAMDFGFYVHLQMLTWNQRTGYIKEFLPAMFDFKVQLATYESLNKALQQNEDLEGMCMRTYKSTKHHLERCKQRIVQWEYQKENSLEPTDPPQIVEQNRNELKRLTETLASYDALLAKAKVKRELIERVREAERLCWNAFHLAQNSAHSARALESTLDPWQPAEVIDNKITIQPLALNPSN